MKRNQGALLLGHLMNERGVLFPIAIVLLFMITSSCVTYTIFYQYEIKIYNALELSNVRATIDILKTMNGL